MRMETMTQSVGCVKAATAILGDKWTPQLLRFMANEEGVRFCQLQDLVGGINPRTLSARLTSLEQNEVIEKLMPELSHRAMYRLTDKGRDLLPILYDMQVWGEKYDDTCI
jgi:DNA-binding HxlR family transcriptional regulator